MPVREEDKPGEGLKPASGGSSSSNKGGQPKGNKGEPLIQAQFA